MRYATLTVMRVTSRVEVMMLGLVNSTNSGQDQHSSVQVMTLASSQIHLFNVLIAFYMTEVIYDAAKTVCKP